MNCIYCNGEVSPEAYKTLFYGQCISCRASGPVAESKSEALQLYYSVKSPTCPYCGGEVEVEPYYGAFYAFCDQPGCYASGPVKETPPAAIHAFCNPNLEKEKE